MKNRDRPEAIYMLPSDISDDAFDKFVKQLEQKYSGAGNVGKSPIAVQGELEIKELTKLPSDLPYQAARADVRQELFSVSGVSGAKMGITDSMTAANFREARREFHESTMIPLFRLIEMALYEQIHVREFQIIGWEFKFNAPDFLTAVEKATVHMRYQQMGVLNPNEIRQELGRLPRDDDEGDLYVDQSKSGDTQPDDTLTNPQGSPPEGRPIEPDDPSQIGEPTDTINDPVRGDQHDETPRNSALSSELHTWRAFAINRVKRGKSLRSFQSDVIPAYLNEAIQECLDQDATVDGIKEVFNKVETYLEE
jgi:hypothetical protein